MGGFQNEFAASVSASPSAVSVIVCLAASLSPFGFPSFPTSVSWLDGTVGVKMLRLAAAPDATSTCSPVSKFSRCRVRWSSRCSDDERA